MSTEAKRRYAHEQALACTRIEGHVPAPEFLAECEAVIKGTMTREQQRARSIARALADTPAHLDDLEDLYLADRELEAGRSEVQWNRYGIEG